MSSAERNPKAAGADAERASASEKTQIDKELDNALESTFPASDPVTVGQPSTEPDRPIDRRPPIIDLAEVRRLARKVK